MRQFCRIEVADLLGPFPDGGCFAALTAKGKTFFVRAAYPDAVVHKAYVDGRTHPVHELFINMLRVSECAPVYVKILEDSSSLYVQHREGHMIRLCVEDVLPSMTLAMQLKVPALAMDEFVDKQRDQSQTLRLATREFGHVFPMPRLTTNRSLAVACEIIDSIRAQGVS